ncbi:MAG: zinc ribbon domain-containing protein, partial [Caldilinea sp.]|nr:zinc ribbon domain-containing protein [Caldilinea sp.]MCB0151448.1 zinc ribbon domain-containing protein [Caldilineaceae bacterium]
AEIASRRRVAAATPVQPAAANGAAEDAPRFCTECGSRVAAQHKFCASCGAPLAELATTPQ